jgi:ribonucleoside-diphosphate reductase alpha chain
VPETKEKVESKNQSHLFAAEETAPSKNKKKLPKDSFDWQALYEELPEPVIPGNGQMVLNKRYLQKDESGEIIETPKDLFFRVARFVANAELRFDPKANVGLLAKEFYQSIANFDFLPNSPTLMNADRPLGQLSACFVLPINDSMEEIFDAIKFTALIHKSGGGTGFSFSRLRPSGDRVKSTSGISSGPLRFMYAFNEATETVKQGGTRRGANMGILRVDHPDILEFISAKEQNNVLNNFNLSVGLTKKFMDALETGADYDLVNPHGGQVFGQLNSKDVYDKIIYHAWKSGEPGIIFLDRMNEFNPTPAVGEIESTNPCGEQPLLPYESCNLGSINVGNFVINKGSKAEVDYDRLRSTVHMATRFLDNVIEVNKYPLPQIDKTTKSNRKIGLGLMGFADLLIKLGIPYNSEKGLKTARKIMSLIDTESKNESRELARRRGVFPNWDKSIYKDRNDKLRNATTTTIAPTGTISIIAGASSGVEPLFAVAFERQNVLDNDTMVEVNPLFKQIAEDRGFYSEDLIKKIAEAGSISDFVEIPEDVKAIFSTAQSISPEWHIQMQAAFQEFTDNAVSKTVNFQHSATEEEIREAYDRAYKLGCKGLTVYRDGSRDTQVLNTGATQKSKDAAEPEKQIIYETLVKPRPRPAYVQGTTEKIPSGLGDMYITINEDEDGINEIFIRIGKSGGEAAAMNDALARIISVSLRSGVDPKVIVKHLKGIRGANPVWQNGELILSCPDAIAKAIDRYINRANTLKLDFKPTAGADQKLLIDAPPVVHSNHSEADYVLNDVCPECSGKIEYESGCFVCHSCGYSKCA